MINRVIISGVIKENQEIKLIKNKMNPDFCFCTFIITTQDSKQEKLKEVKITMYNQFAKDFIANQELYMNKICMFYGEISYYRNEELNKEATIIKINEPPQILAKLEEE